MRFTILIITILFPLLLKADGTLFLSDIEPLLQQQPELWSAFKKAFDIRDVGMASRIGLTENEGLHGKRLAPYIFDAKPQGSNGPFIFTIKILAKTTFYNSKGKKTTVEDAVKVKEELESIVIQKRPQDEIQAEAELDNPKGK
ncbi:MAG: hypothetical protein WCD79_19550 [Chthoniobacteraceae bacterium]